MLNFAPYTKEQISNIVKDRLTKSDSCVFNLKELQDSNNNNNNENKKIVFENSAIDFCARKISTSSGDIRKALDICSQAIVNAEEKQKVSKLPYVRVQVPNVCICKCLCMYVMYMYIFVYVCMYMYMFVYVCMYVCVCMCMYVYVCMCVCVCMCMFILYMYAFVCVLW